MHVGPFADEGPTIERIDRFIGQRGGEMRGKHHEIYLSDFRRTAPERLKTIIAICSGDDLRGVRNHKNGPLGR